MGLISGKAHASDARHGSPDKPFRLVGYVPDSAWHTIDAGAGECKGAGEGAVAEEADDLQRQQ